MKEASRHHHNRKEQIIAATYALIMVHGVSGATITRIAASVGVAEAALYRHFKSKRDILLAVFELAASRFFDALMNDQDNLSQYIQTIGLTLNHYIIDNPTDVKVMYEFICAPLSEGLRGIILERFLELLKYFENLLTRGIAQGLILDTTNPNQIVWELISLGSTIVLASMLDIQHELDKDLVFDSLYQLHKRICV